MINVMGVFDGMSCGQLALKKAGIPVNKYYASEVDKYAIKVTMDNFPNTIQLGDCQKISGYEYLDVDLLMAGSPCQGFSFAGKQLNFEDPRSKLFFEFVRLKEEINPKYWLLENVPMRKEYLDVITKYVGVEPVVINSGLVSAQNRKRYYWTNIPGISQPEDKGILIKDILEAGSEVINYSSSGRGKGIVEKRISEAFKSYTLTAAQSSNRSITLVPVYHLPHGFNRGGVFDRDKMPSLRKDHHSNYYILNGEKFRKLSVIEHKRLQTVPDDYIMNVSDSQAYKMLGNGWTVDVIAHILKGIKIESSEC